MPGETKPGSWPAAAMTVPDEVFDHLLARLDQAPTLAPALEPALAQPRFENRPDH